MPAFRIFSRFAELLDINVTRAAVAWLRLNADGSITERTAAQTLTDLGFDQPVKSTSSPTFASITNTSIQRVSRLADDATNSATVPLDVTGLTFTLAAATWYKLEVAFRYTSAATAGYNINLLTTGTFQTVELFNGTYGPSAAGNSLGTVFPSTTTRICLRGANGVARTNAMGFATAYFKTNASGTGKIAICRDGAGTEATSHEIVAVLSPF